MDITKEDQVKTCVQKVVKEFGTVDILINNAGGAGVAYPIEEMPEEVWDQTFSLNLKSQYFFCKYVVPILKAKKSGKIINLSSIGVYQPPAHHIAYNSAKAATIGFTNDLAGRWRNIISTSTAWYRAPLSPHFTISESVTCLMSRKMNFSHKSAKGCHCNARHA